MIIIISIITLYSQNNSMIIFQLQTSKEFLMKQWYILLQVFLGFFQYPLFEEQEIECMRIIYIFTFQPIYKMWEVVRDLPSIKYSVYHVATKQPHFYFISQMRVYFFVFVDTLENVRSCWAVRKFQIVKTLLSYIECVSLIKIFYGHVLNYILYQSISILKYKLSFQLLFLKFVTIITILLCFGAFLPSNWVNIGIT